MAERIGSDRDLARELAGRGVAELRAAYECSRALEQEMLANWESLTMRGLLSLREIGDRLRWNGDVNFRAILDQAEENVRAHSPAEIYDLQQRFLEEQSERMADQAKDMATLAISQMRSFYEEIWRWPKG